MTPIPNRVRELRSARDWTQQELSERAGVSRQTINAVETGKYEPSLSLAFILARIFGEPLERIFMPDDGAATP
jgi:putative transcriptional regulator